MHPNKPISLAYFPLPKAGVQPTSAHGPFRAPHRAGTEGRRGARQHLRDLFVAVADFGVVGPVIKHQSGHLGSSSKQPPATFLFSRPPLFPLLPALYGWWAWPQGTLPVSLATEDAGSQPTQVPNSTWFCLAAELFFLCILLVRGTHACLCVRVCACVLMMVVSR